MNMEEYWDSLSVMPMVQGLFGEGAAKKATPNRKLCRPKRTHRGNGQIMVEMLESRLMPSSLQGLGQAHRERLHHPKQAQPIQPETLTNLSFEHAQFASLSGDDCVPSGCCSETDPGLPPGVKSANPPIKTNGGIIADKDGNLTGYGDIGKGTLKPLGGNNWQQLGPTTVCCSVVIQLPTGGFAYYHLGNKTTEVEHDKKAMADLNKFLDTVKAKLNGLPPSCIRVVPGNLKNGMAEATCKVLTDAMAGHGIAVPDEECMTRAPRTPNPNHPDPTDPRHMAQDDMWVDPSGHIHFVPPAKFPK